MKGEQLVATLQSGEATKMFYGYSAAKEAYEEASDGDIITLSKGNFEDFTIEKAITLRGAGAFLEGESTAFKNLYVNADNAIVEGICFTSSLTVSGNKLNILRCDIDNLNGDAGTSDLFVSDCAIKEDKTGNKSINTIYRNCAIRLAYSHTNLPTFQNCVVVLNEYSAGNVTNTVSSQGYFFNSIISLKNSGGIVFIPTPNQFVESLIYHVNNLKFEDGVQIKDSVISQITSDEKKNKFGSDKFPYFFSEEVTTIEGVRFVCGVVDHKEWPAIPRVVESNIAKETDEAGHLKVQVKVSCER